MDIQRYNSLGTQQYLCDEIVTKPRSQTAEGHRLHPNLNANNF